MEVGNPKPSFSLYFFSLTLTKPQSSREGPPECDDEDLDSDATVDAEEAEGENQATKARKRAGIPEVDVDQLPSSVANKMMNLSPIVSICL